MAVSCTNRRYGSIHRPHSGRRRCATCSRFMRRPANPTKPPPARRKRPGTARIQPTGAIRRRNDGKPTALAADLMTLARPPSGSAGRTGRDTAAHRPNRKPHRWVGTRRHPRPPWTRAQLAALWILLTSPRRPDRRHRRVLDRRIQPTRGIHGSEITCPNPCPRSAARPRSKRAPRSSRPPAVCCTCTLPCCRSAQPGSAPIPAAPSRDQQGRTLPGRGSGQGRSRRIEGKLRSSPQLLPICTHP
jgi:hypothetical protein